MQVNSELSAIIDLQHSFCYLNLNTGIGQRNYSSDPAAPVVLGVNWLVLPLQPLEITGFILTPFLSA